MSEERVMPLPCADQTLETVKNWVDAKPLAVGDQVVVRNEAGGLTEYQLDVVVAIDHTKQRRVVLKQHGSFHRDGKNCYHPNGPTQFLQPTPELINAAQQHKAWLHGEPVI